MQIMDNYLVVIVVGFVVAYLAVKHPCLLEPSVP